MINNDFVFNEIKKEAHKVWKQKIKLEEIVPNTVQQENKKEAELAILTAKHFGLLDELSRWCDCGCQKPSKVGKK